MGEQADMMLDGTLCMECGVANDEPWALDLCRDGKFPWVCKECAKAKANPMQTYWVNMRRQHED